MQQHSLRPRCGTIRMNALRGLLGQRNWTSGVRAPTAEASHVARATSDTATQPATSSAPTSFRHGITHTNYEGNSWSVKFNNTGVQLLVDPWLEEDLTFFGQDWLYRSKKRHLNTPKGGKVDINQIIAETDLVVITQWLDDHLHMPTIQKLPRDFPIIANPEAADKLKPLGFTNIKIVDHGETVQVAEGRLSITAFPGALVGPPWSKRQNGYLFREVLPASSDLPGTSLLYEPHCDFVERDVAKLGKVDIVITPVSSTLLGVASVGYPVVMGDMNLKKLLKHTQPKVLVPLQNAVLDASGPVSALVFDRGGIEQTRQMLRDNNFDTRLELAATPGEAWAIAL